MSQSKVTEAIVTIHVSGADDRPASAGYSQTKTVKIQDENIIVEFRYGDSKPTVKDYLDWPTAAYYACLACSKAGLDTFELLLVLDPEEEHRIQVYVPANFLSKGEKISGPLMLQVERQLERRGFEANHGAKGMWTIHRPDPRDGYAKRGYFDAAQTIRLAASNSDLIDEAIRTYWARRLTESPTARYLNLKGDRRMVTKKEGTEEAPAKKQTTAKAIDGTDVGISPKQEEMLEKIREQSASNNPVGSDDERLDDPSSIAAMKLATGEHPIVFRGKFGTRWHYFAKQKDLDTAIAAAEKVAQTEKDAKAAKKKPAKEEAAADAQASKRKGGPLKKPSEK